MPHDNAFWQAIAQADYAVPEGESVQALTAELLGYLSSPDMELRDGIAYTTMAHWATRGLWSADDFRMVSLHVIPDMQRFDLEGDGVILRSFSALTLSLVPYMDWKNPFITPEEYAEIVDAACNYLAAETDLRGYVERLGWLHATAHTADILKFLARGQHATHAHLSRMLTAIADKAAAPTSYVYIHSEDDRMALAVLDILKRGMLNEAEIAAFIARLLDVADRPDGDNFDPAVHALYMNVKNLLRALYFKLSFADPQITGAHDLAAQAFEALKKFGM